MFVKYQSEANDEDEGAQSRVVLNGVFEQSRVGANNWNQEARQIKTDNQEVD